MQDRDGLVDKNSGQDCADKGLPIRHSGAFGGSK